jgi:hypothetical protein
MSENGIGQSHENRLLPTKLKAGFEDLGHKSSFQGNIISPADGDLGNLVSP